MDDPFEADGGVHYPDLTPLKLNSPSGTAVDEAAYDPLGLGRALASNAPDDAGADREADGLSPVQRVRAARLAFKEKDRHKREEALAQARRETMEERRALAARMQAMRA